MSQQHLKTKYGGLTNEFKARTVNTQSRLQHHQRINEGMYQESVQQLNQQLHETERRRNMQQQVLLKHYHHQKDLLRNKHKELLRLKHKLQNVSADERMQINREQDLQHRNLRLLEIENDYVKRAKHLESDRELLQQRKNALQAEMAKFEQLTQKMSDLQIEENTPLTAYQNEQLDNFMEEHPEIQYNNNYAYQSFQEFRESVHPLDRAQTATMASMRSTIDVDRNAYANANHNNNGSSSSRHERNPSNVQSMRQSRRPIYADDVHEREQHSAEYEYKKVRKTQKSRTRKVVTQAPPRNARGGTQQRTRSRGRAKQASKKKDGIFKRLKRSLSRKRVVKSENDASVEDEKYHQQSEEEEEEEEEKAPIVDNRRRKSRKRTTTTSKAVDNGYVGDYDDHYGQRRTRARSVNGERRSRRRQSGATATRGQAHSGDLYIRLVNARNVFGSKGSTPNTFVELECNGKVHQSAVIRKHSDPEWDETFKLPITNYTTDKLHLRLIDAGNDRVIANMTLPVSDFVQNHKQRRQSRNTARKDLTMNLEAQFD